MSLPQQNIWRTHQLHDTLVLYRVFVDFRQFFQSAATKIGGDYLAEVTFSDDLLRLNSIRYIDTQIFQFQIFVRTVFAAFASQPAAFHAAERCCFIAD